MNKNSSLMDQTLELERAILFAVQHHKIREQNELQQVLHQQGYSIPQATLSRRLKKMGIAKVAGLYKVIENHASPLPLILSLHIAEAGLIVLQTPPGQAGSLAYFFDQKYVPHYPPLLGTIAGDDTVLLILKSKDHCTDFLSLMIHDFPYLPIKTYDSD